MGVRKGGVLGAPGAYWMLRPDDDCCCHCCYLCLAQTLLIRPVAATFCPLPESAVSAT